MEIGLTPKPEEARDWFAKFPPPAFTRIFSPRGSGLPWNDHRFVNLPPGTLPWISYKDPVSVPELTDYFGALVNSYPGRTLRVTHYHEPAPMSIDDRVRWRTRWDGLLTAASCWSAIEPVQIHSGYAMRWRQDTEWRDWIIPGVTVAFDIYPPEYGDRYEPPESIFAILQQAASRAGGVRWGCAEWGAHLIGAHRQHDRAAYLIDSARYLRMCGASFMGLWCSNEIRNFKTYDYRPTDADLSMAFKQVIEGDY